ncbi:MAG TPA: hypothetical protein VEX18_09855 [Polyangiaceae bacterium]|nr:hypothetical protein [Polyangiaceae bacterium]
MNRNTFLFRSTGSQRLLLATLASLALSGACSDDDATVVPPVDLTLQITSLDGEAPEAESALRCDGLGVEVAISPASGFTLRPLHACGSSNRCGYVHLDALDADDNVLGSVDSVTTFGLLELPQAALAQLAAVRAVLLRGIDGEPVTNADRSEVAARVDVSRSAPSSCEAQGMGGQGQGGQGQGGSASGGPGEAGATSAGATTGGAASGGAGGSPTAEQGGAGGTPSEPNAGSGGA